MGDPMEELAACFESEARQRSDEIGGLLQALTATDDRAATCDLIRDHAHKIKGAAGVFGHDELKAAAAQLEDTAASERSDAEIAAAAAGVRAALPG